MPRASTETVTQYTIRVMRDEYLREAEKVARGNAPESEPDAYWKGRRDAADLIAAMISER